MTKPPDYLLPEEALRLRHLKRALSTVGYGSFLASFPREAYRPEQFSYYRSHTSSPLRNLIDFFLTGRPVHIAFLDEHLGKGWRVLLELNLALQDGRWARMNGYLLLFYDGHLFFVEAPSANPGIYFGDDSLGMFARLAPSVGDVCLDIGSGSGILALQCANYADKVYAVEVNPRAARMIAINSALNGREEKLRILEGDLFEPVKNMKFDYIVSNPPLVPFPDDLPYAFVGHGGLDGLKVTRNILLGLPNQLNPHGRADIVAASFSDGVELLASEALVEIAKEAGLDLDLFVVSHFPLAESGWLESLWSTSAAYAIAAGTEPITKETLQTRLDALGLTHIASYTIHARIGEGRVRYNHLTKPPHKGLWFLQV